MSDITNAANNPATIREFNRLRVTYETKDKEIVTKVIDSDGEVVRQIPPEEQLRIQKQNKNITNNVLTNIDLEV